MRTNQRNRSHESKPFFFTMNQNSDPEEILNFSSNSESESEGSFHGFDITDVRSLLDEATQVPLHTSTPRQKKKPENPRL